MEKKNKNDVRTENMDDNNIIAHVQGGESDYFDEIIGRYEQKLFYYVMRFVKNSDEARDIVQNVFIKTLNHIDSFDQNKKFSSWIYRIAHNETMNWFTRSNRKKLVSIDDTDVNGHSIELSDPTSATLEEWFHIELRDELHNAVAQLPNNYAQVIRLRYFEDKSYKEISKIIGKSTNSVGTLLRRAKKRLLLIVVESEKF